MPLSEEGAEGEGLDSETLRNLFESVRSGRVDIDEAVRRFAILPFLDTEHGRIDTHRALRQGIPEVIFGRGRRPSRSSARRARCGRRGSPCS